MNLFQKVRDWFGVGITDFEPEPVEVLESLVSKAEFLENELDMIKALDIDDEVINEIKSLVEQIKETKEAREEVESDILQKAIKFTALITDEERAHLKSILDVWGNTGQVAGKIVPVQTVAISKAVDIIAKSGGGEGSRGGNVIGHTRNGHPIYMHQRDYPHFNSHDHVDAAQVHNDMREKTPIGDPAHEHHDEMHAWHKRKSKNEDIKWQRTKSGLHGEVVSGSHSGGSAAKGVHYLTHNYWPFSKGGSDIATDLEGHYANVIVKDDNGKILFLKRADDKVLAPGQYCLPGGHIDEGETLLQAAARELKEEANIECEYFNIVGKAKCDDGRWAFYIAGKPKEFGALALLDNENTNASWMTTDEWLEADLFFDLKDHLCAIEMPTETAVPVIFSKGDEDEETEEEEDEIEKGQFYGSKGKGEGSKGGRVIGHTKSGKPVYARLTGNDREYRKFSPQDHADAAAHHAAQRKPGEGHTYGTSGSTEMYWHGKRQEEHQNEGKKKGGEIKKAGTGEGSRGGRVIGHTKSGDPIYLSVGSIPHEKQEKLEHTIIGDSMRQFVDHVNKHGHNLTHEKIDGGTSDRVSANAYDKKGQHSLHNLKHLLSKHGVHSEVLGWSQGGGQSGYSLHYDGTQMVSKEKEDLHKSDDPDLIKGKRGVEGEIRTWKGRKYQKRGKEWIEMHDGKDKKRPMAVKDVVAHAENTSIGQLKKVAADPNHPHNDSAKRQLERLKADKEKNKPVSATPVAVKPKLKPKTVNIKKTKSLEQLVEKYPEVYGDKGEGDFNKTFDNFYSHVAAKHEAFMHFAQKLADDVGGELVMGPVKSKERAKLKTKHDFGGDISKLNDIIRCTIIMKTPMQVKRGMNNLFKNNREATERYFADFKSDGYNGGNINLRMPDGVPTEIQFNTPINMALKDNIIDHPLINKERDVLREGGIIPGKGHDFYESLQKLDRAGEGESEKAKKINSWMKRYYGFREYFQKALEYNNLFDTLSLDKREEEIL